MSQDAPSAGIGVLLINLGTPDAPTEAALRRYLREFLSDRRVIDTPRAVWLPILHGIVLRTRPRRSAEAYAKIWTEHGSPLLVISRRQQQALREGLERRLGQAVPVALGMRYGEPSVAAALAELQAAGVQRLLVLPLYPQYSATTTGTALDVVFAAMQKMRNQPALHCIRDYHDEPGYIAALASSVRMHWQQHGRGQRLLMSFHGIPLRYSELGDPYAEECRRTGQLLAERLGLDQDEWLVTFQSRFGREQWLTPYTDETLEGLARQGVRQVDLICPGFSADCVETLEENAIQNRALFEQAGGERLSYIPCLNDAPDHIAFLTELILRHLRPWLPQSAAG
ncbi:MAG: ferrochelatase [Xanthomonadaceae bacterium]|nr:ferrochelatase [Xanthomonadaceae bacterium]